MRITSNKLLAFTFFSTIILCLGPSPTLGEDYPSRPIQIIVPYNPGGAVDTVARLIGQHLSESIGKPVVAENKVGASGNIGAQIAAKSPADGYTLLLAALTTYSINEAMYYKSMGFDLRKDFSPIAVVGNMPLILVVNSSLSVTSVRQLIERAKSKPGELTFASAGNGSIEHAVGEMFQHYAGIKMLHVPYKGAGQFMIDLLAGRVDMVFATAPTATANLQGNRLRALAVAAPRRIPTFPDLPTMSESGMAGFEAGSTYGILSPAGTPTPIVQRLNSEIKKVLEKPAVKDKFAMLGINIMLNTPVEAGHLINAEVNKWKKTIADAGIKGE
jgi:tripartite-type tricarboxylate transporter receptor subunit TctC